MTLKKCTNPYLPEGFKLTDPETGNTIAILHGSYFKRVAEIEAIADKDIDTTDIPEAGEDFFKRAKLILPKSNIRK